MTEGGELRSPMSEGGELRSPMSEGGEPFTLLKNSKFQKWLYQLNHVSAETLIKRRRIYLKNNSPLAEVSTQWY